VPRDVTETTLREIFAEETGEVFLTLLEIDDPNLSEKIYAVNDTVDIVHNFQIYKAYPFELALPPSDGETLPSLRIRISNVSLSLITLVRNMTNAPIIRVKVIRAADPETAIVDVQRMRLKGVSADMQVLEFEVMSPDFLTSKFTGHTYNFGHYRGLFR